MANEPLLISKYTNTLIPKVADTNFHEFTRMGLRFNIRVAASC